METQEDKEVDVDEAKECSADLIRKYENPLMD